MEGLKARIFDIRRFSTHDGNGIRTTVFFKGCPLSCVWCHNPEGINPKQRVMYFSNHCIGCGNCLRLAKNGGVTLAPASAARPDVTKNKGTGKDEKNGLPTSTIRLDVTKDEDWNSIVDACPSGAMAWDSSWMPVEDVLEQVLKDLPFYRYGGGVTLSGGEPLMQPAFALELLKALKHRGVHTAIETSLFAPSSVLEEILPYLDFVYADCKLFDGEEHQRYTGVPNELIKENLRILLNTKHGKNVTIRTPMIPQITATAENIAAISRFLCGINPGVTYELLNYNPLAEAKYHLLDKEYYAKENPGRYSSQDMEAFAQIARNHGIQQVIIES